MQAETLSGKGTGVAHHARHSIIALCAQFLLGMAVNLIGLPSQTAGTAHVATTALLVAHVVIALGIAAGAIMTVRAAEKGSRERALAMTAAAVVAVTIGAGVLTLATKSNWWSYFMAVGFLASLLLYFVLLLRARTQLLQSPSTAAEAHGVGGRTGL